MNGSNLQTPSPMIKGEDFHDDDYDMGTLPFSAESTPVVVDPLALLATPGQGCDAFSPEFESSPAPEDTPEAGDGKKTKKRKSWGQVLPEPKTNLPPRKRAKTEDEKEQRRVERVLRNRRAAQSSRERKRQETELLAKRNHQLEEAMRVLMARTAKLEQELKKVRPDFEISLPSTDSLTLSQPLFTETAPKNGAAGDDDMKELSQSTLNLLNTVFNSPNREAAAGTVNLASISPAPSPVPEESALEPITEDLEPEIPQTTSASTTLSTAGGDDFEFWQGNPGITQSGPQLFDNLPDLSYLGDIPSPATDDLDFDNQHVDEDFFDFLHQAAYAEGDGAAADQQFPPQDEFAAQAPTEASNLQPTAGASSTGCDARGTAVEAQ